MRKTLSFILVLTSVFLLFGCQETTTLSPTYNETHPANPTTEATEATEIQQESLQLPLYTISMPQITESTLADDGTVVFRHVYQNISLILPEAEVADKVILDFLNQQDSVSAYAKTASESAKQSYSNDNQWNAHLLQMLYAPMRFDGGILSLYGNKVSYTGGAHSVYSGQSLNYDLLTGKHLLLTDIIHNNINTDTVIQLITKSLSVLAENKQLFPTYADMLSHLIPADLSVYTHWYLSDYGLCFYFTAGEIAPYATGAVVAEIPYDQLTGTLLDAYFPAEKLPEKGTVHSQSFETADHTNFNRYSELILQKDGQKILLHTEGTVYDVRICEIEATNGTSDANGSSVLYAAHTLSHKDAILIEADFNAVLLRLSYYTADGLQEFNLSFDGASVSLTEV